MNTKPIHSQIPQMNAFALQPTRQNWQNARPHPVGSISNLPIGRGAGSTTSCVHSTTGTKSCSRDGTFHLNSYLVNNAAVLHSRGRLGKPPPLLSWDSFTAAERNPVPASKHSLAFSAQLPSNTCPLSGSVDTRVMMIT